MNCLELFAGCGGLGYGFHKEKFNIVACNEYDPNIAKTYQHNFPDTKVIVGDITTTNTKQKIYDCFTSKNSCDIIIGGPPCVAYSMSGNRNSRDPRGQLFNDYVEIVSILKPKVFVMENVKGILTILHDKPQLTKTQKDIADKYYELEYEKIKLQKEKKKYTDQKSSTEYKAILKTLRQIQKEMKTIETNIMEFRSYVPDIIKSRFDQIGYNVEMRLLNSADYGVPQRRERVIFIGIRKELSNNHTISFPNPTHKGPSEWKTVRQAIDDLKDIDENKDIQHIFTHHTDTFIEKVKKTKIGNSVYPKYKESFFRCDPDKPSNTVKENHGGVFIHYEKHRVMTPRELARLQSFPDDFIFKGSKSSMLIQLGNAVPCGLSHAIAKEISKIFKL